MIHQLKKTDYHDKTFEIEFCLRAKHRNIRLVVCKLCKKEVPETCLKKHEKLCKRCHEYKNCGVVLTATSIKRLESAIAKHICHSRLCKVCFTSLPPNLYKQHSCVMKDVVFQNIYNSCVYFDIETIFENGMSAFEPVMISCMYENVVFGNYNQITFAHKDLSHPDIGKIHKQVSKYDYTCGLPNRIAPLKLNPRYRSRKKCWPQGSDPSLYENHFDLNDPKIEEETETFAKECWLNYEENLRKYAHLTHLQDNCIFKFLCFFMTKSFYNTTFISHNGAR